MWLLSLPYFWMALQSTLISMSIQTRPPHECFLFWSFFTSFVQNEHKPKDLQAWFSCHQDEEADSQLPAKVKPQKGTRKLESRKAKTSEEDEQVAGLTAALQEWQDKSKSSASLLR